MWQETCAREEARGWDALWLRQCGSTMDVAKEMLPGYGKPFALVVAQQQSNGRGSAGRAWLSPAGNVYMTVCVSLDFLTRGGAQPSAQFLLPLTIGISLHATLAPLVDTPESLRLKWPNDVLLGDHKLCGVLVESHLGYAVIGIGVNVETAPTVTDGGRHTARLADHLHLAAGTVNPEAVARAVFNNFVATVDAEFSPEQTRSKWASLVDWTKNVTRRDRPGEVLRPKGISDFGELIVENQRGEIEKISCSYLW
eukprot:TRINITY_DN251_c0_g1_i6.p1 TRINITY_DN251_c0_g1~~TRINITY_DN251_c0_g1_i6.p1  ORF type:complete len:254 (-),score=66.75 TRINITY_DN251_c0_g1_i6:32-793(-)